MYRAYPQPPQLASNAPPGQQQRQPNGSMNNNNGPPTPTRIMPPGTGRLNGTAAKGPAPAGLSSPVSRPMAPPSKKQKATTSFVGGGPVPPSTTTMSTSDQFTQMADEGIARRRAELRHLQSHRSTTADLLARARAVTSSNNNISTGVSNGLRRNVPATDGTAAAGSSALNNRKFGVYGSIGGANASNSAPGINTTTIGRYNSRTRPISLPKSPTARLKQRYQHPPPQQQKQDEEETKKESPNKTIHVQISSTPSSEFANITPMSSFESMNTTNIEAKASDSGSNTNGTTNANNNPPPTINKNDNVVPKAPAPPPTSATITNGTSQPIPTQHPPSHVPPSQPPMLPPTSVPPSQPSPQPHPPSQPSNLPPSQLPSNVPSSQPQPPSQPSKVPPALAIEETNSTANQPTDISTTPTAEEQPNKRETLKFLRDAAQSPAATIPPPINKITIDHSNSNISSELIVASFTNDSSINDGVSSISKQIVTSHTNDSNDERSVPSTKQDSSSSYSKMMKELLETKQLREKALSQVAKLEKEVLDLRLLQTTSSSNSVTNGRGRSSNRDLDRGGNEQSSTRRKRMKSPQPTNRIRNNGVDSNNPLSDEDIACRAVETVEDIFSSDLATYVVRKPYGGNETMEYYCPSSEESGKKKNLQVDCKLMWHESVENYLKLAKVQDEASIEVIARVDADNSVLLLHGSSCRHGVAVIGNEGSIVDFDWTTYDDIEKMDKSLGGIIYIDSNGDEGEYWLDTIYEEALKIRENYCSNVFSAALALKAASIDKVATASLINQPEALSPIIPTSPLGISEQCPRQLFDPNAIPAEPKVPSVDACVGTSDDPTFFKPEKTPMAAPTTKVEIKKRPVPNDDPVEMESGSSDALSAFFIFFFGSIFSIVWFVISIPFRLMKWALFATMIWAMISLTWLYFADDNGAMNLGAGIDYHMSPPGVV